jgi:hypothetical protein
MAFFYRGLVRAVSKNNLDLEYSQPNHLRGTVPADRDLFFESEGLLNEWEKLIFSGLFFNGSVLSTNEPFFVETTFELL